MESDINQRFGIWWVFDISEFYFGATWNKQDCPVLTRIEDEYEQVGFVRALTIYICIVPCFPVVVRLQSKPVIDSRFQELEEHDV